MKLISDYSLPTTNYPLIVLIGPTSSGKSELAVKFARRFNGEIISADSRQIYRGMDLGTGKIHGRWITTKMRGRAFYEYKGIRHYCIDFINPKRQYSASLFKRDAQKAILDILKRGKLPILCGGTAHWVDAVVYNQELPDVKPNKKLRSELEKKSADVLFEKLMKFDPARANTIDKFNKRRLIRALEIIAATGKPVPPLGGILSDEQSEESKGSYQVLWLGIKTNQKNLYKKIEKRLKERLKQGLVKEVKKLHANGLSWKKLESFGLEYRFISLYLQKKINYDQMFTQLLYAIKHYSKRQTTWWKRNKEIKWIKPEIKVAEKLTKQFLSSRNFLRH